MIRGKRTRTKARQDADITFRSLWLLDELPLPAWILIGASHRATAVADALRLGVGIMVSSSNRRRPGDSI